MPESSSIPKFSGEPTWGNQWYLSNSTAASVELTESGLRLNKSAKHPVHLILNGGAGDLSRLSSDSGVAVGRAEAFAVRVSAIKSGDLSIKLVIHEFDASGERLARVVVDNRSEHLYVPNREATSLVVSLRTSGVGYATVQELSLLPTANAANQMPGLHSMAPVKRAESSSPTSAEGIQDLKKFLLKNRTFHQKLASTTYSYIAVEQEKSWLLVSNLDEKLDRVMENLDSVEEKLNKIESRMAKIALSETLRDIPGVSVSFDS